MEITSAELELSQRQAKGSDVIFTLGQKKYIYINLLNFWYIRNTDDASFTVWTQNECILGLKVSRNNYTLNENNS